MPATITAMGVNGAQPLGAAYSADASFATSDSSALTAVGALVAVNLTSLPGVAGRYVWEMKEASNCAARKRMAGQP